jgi:hypothetical protein
VMLETPATKGLSPLACGLLQPTVSIASPGFGSAKPIPGWGGNVGDSYDPAALAGCPSGAMFWLRWKRLSGS